MGNAGCKVNDKTDLSSQGLCDSSCQSRRLYMTIFYLAIFLLCFGFALCHFLFTFIRRKRKESQAVAYSTRWSEVVVDLDLDPFANMEAGVRTIAETVIFTVEHEMATYNNANSNGRAQLQEIVGPKPAPTPLPPPLNIPSSLPPPFEAEIPQSPSNNLPGPSWKPPEIPGFGNTTVSLISPATLATDAVSKLASGNIPPDRVRKREVRDYKLKRKSTKGEPEVASVGNGIKSIAEGVSDLIGVANGGVLLYPIKDDSDLIPLEVEEIPSEANKDKYYALVRPTEIAAGLVQILANTNDVQDEPSIAGGIRSITDHFSDIHGLTSNGIPVNPLKNSKKEDLNKVHPTGTLDMNSSLKSPAQIAAAALSGVLEPGNNAPTPIKPKRNHKNPEQKKRKESLTTVQNGLKIITEGLSGMMEMTTNSVVNPMRELGSPKIFPNSPSQAEQAIGSYHRRLSLMTPGAEEDKKIIVDVEIPEELDPNLSKTFPLQDLEEGDKGPSVPGPSHSHPRLRPVSITVATVSSMVANQEKKRIPPNPEKNITA